MNSQALCDTIDLAKRDFSLILVKPREAFLEWVNAFVKLKGLEVYRMCIPEENTVLVIPNRDRFSYQSCFEDFLNVMKPKLLHAELSRIHKASPAEFGHPITKETFDKFFEIALRDSASIRFMSDFKDV